MNYIHVAQRLFNTPLLIAEPKLQVILHVLAPRIGFEAPILVADASAAENIRRWPDESDHLKQSGIRVLEINGTLVNRYATAPSGVASYDDIKDQLRLAEADSRVRGAMLRMNTFGGEAAGAADTADVIRKVKLTKPVWASIDNDAFSAGYFLASQADRIFTTRDGGVGSVGVRAVHYDFSKANEKEGIRPTVIAAGAKKGWFNPDQPLQPEALTWLQDLVNEKYEEFVRYVAEGRGMTIDAVKATEAGIFSGRAGVDIGFADEIGTFEQALEAFAGSLQRPVIVKPGAIARSQSGGKAIMAELKTTAEQPTVDEAKIAAEARQAERQRIKAILTNPEAKGRESLANHIAFETDMNSEGANGMLAASPKTVIAAEAPKQKGEFAAHMDKLGNPKVGTDAGADEDTAAAEIARVLAVSGHEVKH